MPKHQARAIIQPKTHVGEPQGISLWPIRQQLSGKGLSPTGSQRHGKGHKETWSSELEETKSSAHLLFSFFSLKHMTSASIFQFILCSIHEHSICIHKGSTNVSLRNVILGVYGVVQSKKDLQEKCPRPAQLKSAALNQLMPGIPLWQNIFFCLCWKCCFLKTQPRWS